MVVGLVWLAYRLWGTSHYQAVHNFDQCVQADYPFTNDDPQVCTDPLGHKFTHVATSVASVPVQTALTFDTLVISTNGPAKAERTVITNQADWVVFWQRAHAHLSFKPTLIPVDFAKKEVVAVLDGQHPMPGFYTKIEEVAQQSEIVLVTINESAPPSGCIVPGAPVSPYHIIQIDKTDLPVRFAVHSSTLAANCKK